MVEEFFRLSEKIGMLFYVGVPVFLMLNVLVLLSLVNAVRKLSKSMNEFSMSMMIQNSKPKENTNDTPKQAPANAPWKCLYCGIMNKAEDINCVQCGHKRGRMINGGYSNAAQDNTQNNNASAASYLQYQSTEPWACVFCGTRNNASDRVCKSCGKNRFLQ